MDGKRHLVYPLRRSYRLWCCDDCVVKVAPLTTLLEEKRDEKKKRFYQYISTNRFVFTVLSQMKTSHLIPSIPVSLRAQLLLFLSLSISTSMFPYFTRKAL